MSETRTAPVDAKVWATATERRLYADALVRVMGEKSHDGRLLCEVLSGELAGVRLWLSERELVRDGEGAEG